MLKLVQHLAVFQFGIGLCFTSAFQSYSFALPFQFFAALSARTYLVLLDGSLWAFG
jgi:hypothetical protein